MFRQRNVGSVVTQSHDDEDSDEDEDEPNNEVFGVATVIKLNKDQVWRFYSCQILGNGKF